HSIAPVAPAGAEPHSTLSRRSRSIFAPHSFRSRFSHTFTWLFQGCRDIFHPGGFPLHFRRENPTQPLSKRLHELRRVARHGRRERNLEKRWTSSPACAGWQPIDLLECARQNISFG